MKTYTEEKRIRPDILTAALYWSVIIMMIYNIISVRIFGDKGAYFSSGPLILYFFLYVAFVLSVQKAVYIMVRLRARRSQFINAEINMQRTFRIFLAAGILLAVLIIGASMVIARNLFGAGKIYLHFILIGISLIFLCTQGVIRGYLQGLGYTKPIMVCDLLISSISFGTGAVISGILYNYGKKVNALFHGDEYSAIYGASGMVIGVLIGSIVGFIHINISMMLRKAEIAEIVKNGAPRYLDNKNDVLTGLRSIIYLYASPLLVLLVDNVFFNIVHIKNGDITELASLSGAFSGRIISFVILAAFLCCTPFIKSWNRVMARIERDELEGARDRLKRLLHFGAMLLVPVCIFLFTASKEIQIMLFGKYSNLIDDTYPWAAFMVFFLALAIFVSWLLNHMGKSILLVVNLSIAWASHIAMMILFVLILKKDLVGIIWALLVSFCIYDVLCFVMLFKMLKYRHDLARNLGMPIISAAVSGLLLLLIEKLLVDRIGEVLTLLIGAVIYIIVYMIIMILLKGVTTEELDKIPLGRLFMGLSAAVQHDRYYEE
jgi:O-antigen/teichoic acid export membrane protein